MTTATGTVVHQYQPTFLRWLMPLFAALGGLIVLMSVGLPWLLRPLMDLSLWLTSGLGLLAGLAMPVGALGLWLTVPAVTTYYDAAREMVTVEYRRPFRRTIDLYRKIEIADVSLVSVGTRAFALGLKLRDGDDVRLEFGSSTDTRALWAQAARLRTALGVRPTLTI